ncbi:MAG TPA: CotH kinase family protein [Tenuifilaceae bacterium]|nr:CotH kinase family protein [Tenuifilaceae bacterium]
MRKYLLFFIITTLFLQFSVDTFSQNLAINEVMPSNTAVLADEEGDFEDWIEIFNFGQTAINLNGYGISDDELAPYKWTFPSISIQPGEYMLVWASGKDRNIVGQPFHTNFNVNASGETIYLTDPDGNLVDEFPSVDVPTDYSYGKYPNGTGDWRFFVQATPGSENIGPGYSVLLSPPVFSHPDGVYESPFSLTISTPDAGAKVYYTLDGSEPNVNSTLYQSPIVIESREGEPNDISMIPTNYDDNPGPPYYEGWQPPLGEVFKINVVRAKVIHPDAPEAKTYTYSYIVDSEGSSRYTLPYFSLATHRDNLFDDEIGIYVPGYYDNMFQEGIEWERPANLSFFETGGKLGFKEDIGIQLNGNTTRSRPRKSIRVCARSEYGNSWIKYPLFSNKPVEKYKRFILRNSGNDWDWAVFRDGFIQYLAKDFSVETQHYFPSILFINGEYWGIHNVRDKYEENYIESHYGIDEDEMTIMQNNSEYKFGNYAGVDQYNSMLSYINSNSMSNSANYQNVVSMMDVESFIDYELIHIYSMNTDWPGNNTLYWKYLRDGYDPDAPVGLDGRWRWMILDTDFGFLLPFYYVPGIEEGAAHNTLAMATEPDGPGWPNPSWSTFLIRKLLENQEFKHKFINRYCDLLNTTFSYDHVLSVIDSISGILEPEMQEHVNRWRRPTSMTEWHSNVDVLRDFAAQRPAYQRQHIKQKFSLSSEVYVTINVSNEIHGHVKINSIDINPRTMGVSSHPYPWTGQYFKGIPIELEAIPQPGYQFSHWEGASSSTNSKITVNLSGDIEAIAHFTKVDNPMLIHYWFFGTNIPNDKPLETIDATYDINELATLNFHSALNGYPFNSSDPSWRKASMERRNNPTNLNYRPEGNNGIPYSESEMRAIQIKQPFSGNGGENTIILDVPTNGFEDIVLKFAVMDEGAASGLRIDYSIADGEPSWSTSGVTSSYSISGSYQVVEVDFTGVAGVENNPNFKTRIRFSGNNLTADEGDRVTFNNISIDGAALNAYSIFASASENGTIVPAGNIGVYQGASRIFSIIPDSGEEITDVLVDGESVLSDVDISTNGTGSFTFSAVSQNHTIHASFVESTGTNFFAQEIKVLLYPNPAKDNLRIAADSRIKQIQLVNSMGSIIHTQPTDSKEVITDVSTLPKGLYVVRIITENGIVIKKLIISR